MIYISHTEQIWRDQIEVLTGNVRRDAVVRCWRQALQLCEFVVVPIWYFTPNDNDGFENAITGMSQRD